jgi:DNA-directed RNA polymerase I subunit RPA2
MGKQTMGTAYHNHQYRSDKKMYRINNPQLPLVRCDNFEEFGYGEYPSGTNAVVAVISYTGYDIEDAMIINKSSYERGFGHGCVYKTVTHPLNADIGMTGKKTTNMKMMQTVNKTDVTKKQQELT